MRNYKSLILYLAAVLLLSVAYFASSISKETGWQAFPGAEALAQAYPLFTALAFLVASALLAFLAFPSMPMVYVAAGFYTDGFGGGASVLLGSALGGLSAFLFYRKHIRRPGVRSTDPHGVRNLWLSLIGLRLSPLVPAPLVNFVAAFFQVSPLQYLLTSLLGSAPLILFYWQIGQQGHQLLAGQSLHWQQFSGYLVILTLSTLLSAMGPWRSVLDEFKRLKGASRSGTAVLLQPAPTP